MNINEELVNRLQESTDCLSATVNTLQEKGLDVSDLLRQLDDNNYFLNECYKGDLDDSNSF